MHKHQINEMAKAISSALGIEGEPHTPEEADDFFKIQDALKKYWEDRIAECWHFHDVIALALERTKYRELTPEEAKEVLHIAMRKFDAEQGINWDVLEVHIEWYCEENNIELKA